MSPVNETLPQDATIRNNFYNRDGPPPEIRTNIPKRFGSITSVESTYTPRSRPKRNRSQSGHSPSTDSHSRQQDHSNSPSTARDDLTHHDHLNARPVLERINTSSSRVMQVWDRFNGRGRNVPSVGRSLRNIALNSWINTFIVFIPVAWALKFTKQDPKLVFAFSILAIIPLEKTFDWLGEQMALFCGTDIGDLITITLNNAVELVLAIILLLKCHLRLLQATEVGVVLLHLLLVPGAAFLTGGAKVWQQHLSEHPTQLNHVLLTLGVLVFLLPAAFYSALNEQDYAITGSTPSSSESGGATGELVKRAYEQVVEAGVVSDTTRDVFLRFSRGLAIMLLIVYIASRIYLHNPPGDNNALKLPSNAPEAAKMREKQIAVEDPEVNPWVALAVIVITVGLMTATAEWLVESLDEVVGEDRVTQEWLGLILLPFVSFAGDGLVAVAYFVETLVGMSPPPPKEIAKGRAIDLSVQFTLLWVPFLVLLAWWSDKPLTLLYDLFEVAAVIGACFLVNYVTADAKTNWVEGLVMVIFYVMIALVAWFYPGQQSHKHMLACLISVGESLVTGSEPVE